MDKLKENYEKAELEVIVFNYADIVTASSPENVGSDPDDWGDWTKP